MRNAWIAWWACLPTALLIQWPGRGVVSSTGLTWAALAFFAGALACAERNPPRCIRLVIAPAFPALLAFQYLIQVVPKVSAHGWFESFGVVSSYGAASCWGVVVLFGTISILRYSPNPRKWLAPFLFWFHSVNLIVFVLHNLHIWSFWKYSENPGGLFPRSGLWAAWGLISLPILLKWDRRSAIPAILAITLARSITCVWLTAFYFIWRFRKSPLAMTGILVLASLFCAVTTPDFLGLVHLRINTWFLCFRMALDMPFGIGYDPMAFEAWMRGHATVSVIPHAASDILGIILKHGLIAVLAVVWGAYYAVNRLNSDNPIGLALIACIGLAVFQKSLSYAHVGILAWVILLTWIISEYEDKSREAKTV